MEILEQSDGATAAARSASEPSRKLRMLIVLPQPFFEERGTSIAVAHVLRAVSDLGYLTDVLSFPQGRKLEITGVNYVELADPFRFRSVPIGFSLKKLLLDVLLFAKTRRQLALRSYSCVYAVEEAAYMAAFLRRKRDLFVVYDMASSLPEQLVQYRRFRFRPLLDLLSRIERRVLRCVDLVVCSSGLEGHVGSVASDTPVLPWRFPATLPRPTDDDLERLRSELALPVSARVVLYAGSFARYQGLEEAIAAARHVLARVPDAVLLFVGASNQTELEELERSIPDDLADRVLLKLRVPRTQIPALLGLADVLLSPRSWGGNVPLKAFEYLDSGRPIVASDIPAHRQLFQGGAALLASPTSTGFAEAIVRVLTDEELATRLKFEGAKYAEDHLGWASFVELVKEIIVRVPPV